jgi:hypothetical protein
MEAPDLQKTIAFVSSFTDLYMLFAGMALIFLTFQAIYYIGFKKIKLAKVFGQYFVKTLALWVVSSALIIIVAGQLMASLWDGTLLLIDLFGDKVAEALKGAF